MRRSKSLYLCLCLLFVGCQDKPADEPVDALVDKGTVENGVYTNKYFNFSINLNENWHVADEQTQSQLEEAGSEIVKQSNKKLGKQLKASEINTMNLLTVSAEELGQQAPTGILIIAIERLPPSSGVDTGKEYVTLTKDILEESGLPYAIDGKFEKLKAGNTTFDVMNSRLTGSVPVVRQKNMAIIDKEFALVLVATYSSDERWQQIEKMLQTFTKK
ncbi:MAG: hypothetical protein VB835_01800 [Pirellulales bacterium]